MAHRILGLDIGRRALKLAIVDKTLRQTSLAGWDEEPLPHQATDEMRTAALQRLMQRNLRPDDVLSVSMPTDAVMHRVLTFPFKDDKSIHEAVGFELENHIPVSVADLSVDFVRLGEKDGQTEVLAVAAPQAAVEKFLAWLRTAAVEPRRVGLTALAYASLVRKLPDVNQGWTMICDFGTRSSDTVLLHNGKMQAVRSLSVGADTVAELFAAHFKTEQAVDEVLAEHAWLLPAGAQPETPDERRLDTATREALDPLVRELRATMAYAMRRSRVRPDRLMVTGALCRLAGLYEYLERALGVPVHGVQLGELPDVKLHSADALGDRGALAVALALAAADPLATDDDVDFRRGDLAYEGDFKVLRARLPYLALFAVAVVVLLGLRTGLTWKALSIEQDAQVAQLEAISKALTGKASSDFDVVQKELAREPAIDVASLYPDMSAFKVYEVISSIHDKVTTPPDYVPPAGTTGSGAPVGGPNDPDPPNPDANRPTAPVPAEPMLRGPGMLRGQVLPQRSLDAPEGSDPNAPKAMVAPAEAQPERPVSPFDRASRRNRGASGAEPDASAIVPTVLPEDSPTPRKTKAEAKDKDKDGDEDSEPSKDKKKSDEPFTGHKIEFAAVQIERTGVTIRGEADTQDALLALQQAIDSHACFGKVKSSSDRILLERHHDWFKFTMQFEVACHNEDKATGKKGKAKGDAAADDEGADKGKKGAKKAESEEEP